MGKNSIYSNSSRSSRMGGGWIYQDGELYHYGRKGMKWYKTIFGGYDNPKSYTYDPDRGLGTNIKNAVSSGWQNTKGFASNASKNFNKYYVNDFKRNISPNTNYTRNKTEMFRYEKTLGNSSMTHLEANMAKQIRDGDAAFEKMVENPSFFNKLNLAIQNAQFDIVSGMNSLLKKIGLDDEVDALLSVFMGNSDRRNWDKAYETGIRRSNPDPNAGGQRYKKKSYAPDFSKYIGSKSFVIPGMEDDPQGAVSNLLNDATKSGKFKTIYGTNELRKKH